jgi:hypothetical protein
MMKGKMQGVSHAVNEALFEVALILATGLFRAQQRTLPTATNVGLSETGLDCPQKPSVHTVTLAARGEQL